MPSVNKNSFAQRAPSVSINSKTDVKFSNIPLVNAMSSGLSKDLNFVLSTSLLPTEGIWSAFEKAIRKLPDEAAEEVGQGSIRILSDQETDRQPKQVRKAFFPQVME